MDNFKMGFAPLQSSSFKKQPVEAAQQPALAYWDYEIPNRAFGWWQYLASVAGAGSTFMYGISYALFKFYVKDEEEEQPKKKPHEEQ